MNDNEIYDIIKSNELFWGLSKPNFDILFSKDNFSIVEFFSGEEIFSSKSQIDAIGIILFGKCITINSNGFIVSSALKVGDIFNLEDNNDFFITIYSETPCQILFLSKTVFLEYIKDDYNITLNYIKLLNSRIKFLSECINMYSAKRPTERVASFLKANFGEYKTFRLSSSFKDVAVSLGISRASLYRAMDEISKSGAIDRQGKSFRLIYPGKLNKFIS